MAYLPTLLEPPRTSSQSSFAAGGLSGSGSEMFRPLKRPREAVWDGYDG